MVCSETTPLTVICLRVSLERPLSSDSGFQNAWLVIPQRRKAPDLAL